MCVTRWPWLDQQALRSPSRGVMDAEGAAGRLWQVIFPRDRVSQFSPGFFPEKFQLNSPSPGPLAQAVELRTFNP